MNSSFVRLYLITVLIFFVFTFNVAYGWNPLTNLCENDGVYNCQFATLADFEVPSSAASTWSYGNANFNSPQITLPYNVLSFNHTGTSVAFFDSDFSVRFYAPYAAFTAAMSAVILPNSGSAKYFEILGNDTLTKRAVFTWANFININMPGSNFTAQMKIFQNGNIEYHYINVSVGSSDTLLVGLEYHGIDGTYKGDFPIYLQNSVTLTNVAYSFLVTTACGDACIPKPPVIISHLSPADFCALQTWDPTLIGYFCRTTSSFFLCFSGDLTIYSMSLGCPAGTTCSCATGVECSDHNLVSPCGY